MTEKAVNNWLAHWVARQGNNKCGLLLVNLDTSLATQSSEGGRSKKGTKRRVVADEDSDADGTHEKSAK